MPCGQVFQQIAPSENNLDCWREPDWSKVRFGLANGYPDEHKKNVSANSIDQVANQLITVVAEVASPVSNIQRTITLNSALDNPHSWYFSGLSGGPLYFVEGLEERQAEDDELFPVGIVFEGYPSSGRTEAIEFAGCCGCTPHRKGPVYPRPRIGTVNL